jgi:hypothetical protein
MKGIEGATIFLSFKRKASRRWTAARQVRGVDFGAGLGEGGEREKVAPVDTGKPRS